MPVARRVQDVAFMAAVHAVSHVVIVNNSMQMQLSFILLMALLRVTVMLM